MSFLVERKSCFLEGNKQCGNGSESPRTSISFQQLGLKPVWKYINPLPKKAWFSFNPLLSNSPWVHEHALRPMWSSNVHSMLKSRIIFYKVHKLWGSSAWFIDEAGTWARLTESWVRAACRGVSPVHLSLPWSGFNEDEARTYHSTIYILHWHCLTHIFL